MSTSAATQVSDLAAAIAKGKRAALAEALNLLDDRRPAARQQSAALLAHLQSEYSNTCSHLIGITGPPASGSLP